MIIRTVYRVNHRTFQTIPVYGDADLVRCAEVESGFMHSLDTALSWLNENNYEVMPFNVSFLT